MASIPLAAIPAAPQAADPPFRALDTSQPNWAAGGASGDSFRDLLRSDGAPRAESSEQPSVERESRPSERPDDTAAAAHAAPANSAPANEDRPSGDDGDGEHSPSSEEPRADGSDDAGNREQPADTAPAAPSFADEESADAPGEVTAADARAQAEKPTKPHELLPESAEKPALAHKATEQPDGAKPAVAQTAANAAAGKTSGPVTADAANGGAPDASAAAKAAAEPNIAVEAPAEPVDVAAPAGKETATSGAPEASTQAGAGTADAAASGEDGPQVSKLHSTVVGPSAPVVETEGESSPAPQGSTGTQATAETSPDAADPRSAPGRAGAPASGPTNVPPAATNTSVAASAPAAAPAPAATTPAASAESIANAAPQEAAPAVSTDAAATGEAAEPASGQNSERTESTARTQSARGEGVRDGSLTVADRVRLVQRAAMALESAHVRGGELRMRLEPPELGSIRVELSSEGGSISARIEAESTQVQRLLLESLPQLRERLAEQQIKIEHFQVDVMNQHDRQFAQMRHDQHDRRGGDARPAPPPGHEAAQGERRELPRDPATLRQQLPWELDRLNVLV